MKPDGLWFALSKISKNRHFCLVTLRNPPRITWVPEPLRNVPPLFKKTLLPDHFCEMLVSDVSGGIKMAVLELGVHTFFQMVIPPNYSSWLAFLSLDTCSQNETWWFVFALSKISKNRHFCLVTLRTPPRITWVPEPLRNVPPLFKKTLLPDHFCEMLVSDVSGGIKMAVLELGVHTFFQMVIPPNYSSWLAFLSLDTCSQNETWWFVFALSKISKNRHFCLVTLRTPPPDHMGARTPKKCTPTIQKNSVARPFLWNVGEWCEWGN